MFIGNADEHDLFVLTLSWPLATALRTGRFATQASC
jgi:hypothetical protein